MLAALARIEAAAVAHRRDGFRGWAWAISTLVDENYDRRSSAVEDGNFRERVRRARRTLLLGLHPDRVGRLHLQAPDLFRAERAFASVRRAAGSS